MPRTATQGSLLRELLGDGTDPVAVFLPTVVGVLVEVPVMLSVCAACNRTRHWFAYERAE